ncbi:unnamed protein product [Mesocestoides corti]|nr:unnamed protein product [Mesocestoides corti]
MEKRHSFMSTSKNLVKKSISHIQNSRSFPSLLSNLRETKELRSSRDEKRCSLEMPDNFGKAEPRRRHITAPKWISLQDLESCTILLPDLVKKLNFFYGSKDRCECGAFGERLIGLEGIKLLSGGIEAPRRMTSTKQCFPKVTKSMQTAAGGPSEVPGTQSLPERRHKKPRKLNPIVRAQDPKRVCVRAGPTDSDCAYTARVSQILDFLYLGNARDSMNAKFMEEQGITHVINATCEHPNVFEKDGKIKYLRVAVHDTTLADLRPHFKPAIDFIDSARNSGGKVLVHCMAGVSRSATLVIAYLVTHSNLTVVEAYTLANHLRSVVGPSFHFLGQVERFRKTLDEARLHKGDNTAGGGGGGGGDDDHGDVQVQDMIRRRWADFLCGNSATTFAMG